MGTARQLRGLVSSCLSNYVKYIEVSNVFVFKYTLPTSLRIYHLESILLGDISIHNEVMISVIFLTLAIHNEMIMVLISHDMGSVRFFSSSHTNSSS